MKIPLVSRFIAVFPRCNYLRLGHVRSVTGRLRQRHSLTGNSVPGAAANVSDTSPSCCDFPSLLKQGKFLRDKGDDGSSRKLHTHSRIWIPAKLQASLPESSRPSPRIKENSLSSARKSAHSPQTLYLLQPHRHHYKPPAATSRLKISETGKEILYADTTCTVRIST